MTTNLQKILSENVPRYTSYPTAPHFHAGIGPRHARKWLSQLPADDAVSLYVHVPFCDKLCWFCACHTKHTRRYEPVSAYLATLEQEIRAVSSRVAGNARIRAMHFGGGSPTILEPKDFVRLAAQIRTSFNVDRDASLSVEIDPNDMTDAKLDALATAGLTRASLGVQDFDPKVQNTINRQQSYALTQRVVDNLRSRGAVSVNLDLLYGLPHQTEQTVAATVRQALLMQPDRIALFGYAHVPWFKKHQTMIDEAWLPDGVERLAQSRLAAAIVQSAGYVPIGIDHFALPDDSLAVAARSGRLRRNFQGYTDDRCETLIGLGPSSISRFRQGYAQNAQAMADYERLARAEGLTTVRGIELTQVDAATGWIIERLMCDFRFQADALTRLFPASSAVILAKAREIARNNGEMLRQEGLCFVVPSAYRPFVRTVAARFDGYLAMGGARHSVAV
jgi:oxygen-independent coproporphyrinogen-3 oxidase